MSPHRAFSVVLRHVALPSFCLASACAPGVGDVTLLVEPERTITDGIEAGSDLEHIQDGWNVTFSKYVMTLGPVELRALGDATDSSDNRRWALDLVRLPSQGEPVWTLSDLEPGRWDLYFGTQAADVERHESVREADFDHLVDAGATHFIEATLAQEDGRSCPPESLAEPPETADAVGENSGGDACYAAPSVQLSLTVTAEVTYGPCSIDGLPGIAVVAGDTVTAAVSVHGDHLFFGGFPEGAEGEVRRYAQWLADCDLDLDGVVTEGELERIAPADLSEFDERFPLGGSPIRPVENLLDYVKSQLSTQGHFQGEGECSIGF